MIANEMNRAGRLLGPHDRSRLANAYERVLRLADLTAEAQPSLVAPAGVAAVPRRGSSRLVIVSSVRSALFQRLETTADPTPRW